MTCMSDTSDAGLWYALNRLKTNYWWDVDLNGGRNAHEFYLPDGLYVVGQNRFAGHDQIRAFYTWRTRRGSTTSRHLINNLQVFATDDHHAGFMAALSLFRANGPAPVRRAPSPCLIADVIGECVRGEDGTWRFRSHVVRPVFLGSDHPLSLSIDGQFLSRRRERIA
jgi:SnoaL-like domain